MANVIGSATIRILPDSSGFSSALQGQLKGVSGAIQNAFGSRGISSIKNFNANIGVLSDNLGRVSNRMIGMGEAMTYGLTRPLIGLAKTSVQAAGDFDYALRTIAAVSNIDATAGFKGFDGKLGDIENAARELGRTSKFSAIESAEGFTDLARAGLEAEDQIDAIRHVVNLATVEDIKLAEATDRLINVYTGFGFKLGDVNKQVDLGGKSVGQLQAVTDVLAQVSSATTASMTSLTDAFRYAGPVAAAAGLSFEETAAALGVLDQAGFKATVGGTGLRGFLTRLAVPTKVNQEQFDNLRLSVEGALGAADPQAFDDFSKALQRGGASAKEINDAWGVQSVDSLVAFREELTNVGIKQEEIFDQAGQMRPLGEVVAIFADRYGKGMFKVGDAMKLFGQRAGPAALAMIQNEALLQSVTEEAGKAGGASQKMADTIQKSANVQFKMMKNALVDLSIAIGQSGVLDFFVGVAQSVSEMANKMADSSPELFRWVFLIGAMVAALGPFRIILGLVGSGLNSFILKPLLLLTNPIGLAIAGVTALAGFFGLMVAKSEPLQLALEALGKTLGAIVLPVLEEFWRIVLGIVGGVGELAGWLGDRLAPAINDVTTKLQLWVAGGGVVDFLQDVLDGIKNVVYWVYEMHSTLSELGVFDAVGAAIERVEEMVQKLWADLEPFRENLIPAIMEVARAFGNTLGLAIRVAWEAASIFLSVIEKILDVLGPIVRFLGDHLVPILGFLAARFLLLRGNLLLTVLGFNLMGDAAIKAGNFIARGFYNAAGAVSTAGRWFGELTQKIANPNLSNNLTRPAQLVERFGQSIERMADRAAVAFGRVGKGFATLGNSLAGIASSSVLPALTGFMSGQMVGNANSLADALPGVATAIMALSAAASIANPVLAIFTIAITTATFAAGALMGKQKAATAVMYDYKNAVRTLVGEMEQIGDKGLSAAKLTEIFDDQLKSLSGQNVTVVRNNLEKLGSNMGEFAKAAAEGGDATEKLVDKLANRFALGQLNGQLKDFKVTVEGIKKDGSSRGIFDIKNVNDVSAAMGKLDSGIIKVKHSVSGAEMEFSTLEETTGALRNVFMNDFLGKAMSDFGKAADDARAEFEATRGVTEKINAEQKDLAQRAKTWSERIEDANSALDESKRKIQNLFTPTEDAGRAIADLFSGLREDLGKLRGPDGKLLLEMPDPTSAGAKEWAETFDQLRNSAGGVAAAIKNEVGFGPEGQQIDEFKTRWGMLTQTMISSLTRPDGPFKLSQQEAEGLANKLLSIPSDKEIRVILGFDDPANFAARLGEIRKLYDLTDKPAEVFAKITTNVAGALDANTLVELAGRLRKASSEAVNIYLNTIQGSPPPGMTWEQINMLIAGGTLPIGELQTFLNILPKIQDIPQMTPEQEQQLAAVLAGKGATSDQVTKTFEALIKNPEQFDQVMALMAFKGLDPIKIPIAIDLIKSGNINFNDPATVDMVMAALMAGGNLPTLDVGGIVGAGNNNFSIPGDPSGVLAIIHMGEAVIPKDVVDKLGADTFRQLIAGNLPTAIVNFVVTLSVEMLGADAVGNAFVALSSMIQVAMQAIQAVMVMGFQIGRDAGLTMLDNLQSEFAISTENMVGYIHNVIFALEKIPGVMESVGSSIRNGFTGPINFIQKSVWPPFAGILNAAARAFGLGNVVPVFHDGGVVGQDGGSHRIGGTIGNDEMMALLQKGEGVMSQEMMASMTAGQLREFRRGNPRWYAVGGPYEDGKSYVGEHAVQVGSSISSYDLDAMKGAYGSQITPMLAAMQARYASNVVATIGAKAVDKIAEGAFDWVRGANEGVEAEERSRLVAIGLPADFDMKGALPAGFDLDSWRSFLGANKAPGDWPLLTRYLDAAGVPYLINSTFRPGGTSYHASGRAVDFGAPGDANYDSPGLLRINHALAPLLGVLSELIYSGPGGISDKAYDASTMAQHHNHVHAALAKGGIVQGIIHALLGEAGPEVVLPLSNPGRALDIALASDLFSILGDAAAQRQGYVQTGPSTLGSVPSGRSVSQGDLGFLGGGPGNTYHIHGVDMDHVKTEIRNRDRAVARVRS